MDNPRQITARPVSPRRRRALLCCLVMLHVAVLGVGLFAWPEMEFDDSAILRIPLVLGGLAAITSLVAIWFALGGLALGRRLTMALSAVLLTWAVAGMLIGGFDSPLNLGRAFVMAVPVTAMFLFPAALTTLALTLLRRRRGWTLMRHGESAQHVASRARRQFGLRHIMLWTLLAAVALAGLRAVAPDVGTAAAGAQLIRLLAIFLGFGAIHTGVSLVTFACVAARPRWWTIVIAMVMTAAFTALSVSWCILWDAGNSEVWPFSLTAVVHFVLLSISLKLLRLAGYQFTRRADTPVEATTS